MVERRWRRAQRGGPGRAATPTGEHPQSGNQLGWDDLTSGRQRTITWDEENRIQKIADNGRTTYFVYNDAGQRIIKRGAQGETAYVNQFWTVRNRSVATKHVYIGSTRIASKVIPGDAHIGEQKDNFSGVLGQWWLHRSQQGWQNGKNTQKNPHYTGNKMPDLLPEDNFVYFYHPDHLGSTSFATDHNGDLYEHVEYFPFGETWVDEHSNTQRLPYLFTSKELDEETGLYYFGARYYDPRASVWESTDPGFGAFLGDYSGNPRQKLPAIFVSSTLGVYGYVRLNPLSRSDPNGMEDESQGRRRARQVVQLPNRRAVGAPSRKPPDVISATGENFGSLTAAIEDAAIRGVAKVKGKTEVGGYVYLDPKGGYVASDIVIGTKRHVNPLKYAKQEHAGLVLAVWHAHVADPKLDQEHFSADDRSFFTSLAGGNPDYAGWRWGSPDSFRSYLVTPTGALKYMQTPVHGRDDVVRVREFSPVAVRPWTWKK